MNKLSNIRIWHFCMVLAFCICLALPSQAQESAGKSWFLLPGNALDISINADGQAYVVAQDTTVWRWDKTEVRWRPMSGYFVRISAAEGNRPWAISVDGAVFRYNGLWWEEKAKDVQDVAADNAGNVYIAKNDGTLHKWYALRSEWRPLPGHARRIVVAHDGTPWIVDYEGSVKAYNGKTWQTFFGRAFDIAAGPMDHIAISTPDGEIRTLNSKDRVWARLDGIENIANLAITPQGGIWAVSRKAQIWTNEKIAAPETESKENKASVPLADVITAKVPLVSVPSAPVENAAQIFAPAAQPITQPGTEAKGNDLERGSVIDPATLTTDENIVFVNTRKSASSLAIGKEGSVFALDREGNVLRWSNRKKAFETFPGKLVRIAVDPQGNPWGISSLGRVFRHDGRTWQQVLNIAASDIAIGGDGSVVIANSSGDLYQYDEHDKRFDRISGKGVLVAVSPQGVVWTIRTDKMLQRCDVSPCQILPQKAISLAIGPDGSVWIVSDTKRLMRLKENETTFETISTLGQQVEDVAVGPRGYPWVTTSGQLAYASSFFARDESGDIAVSATTKSDTVGSGSTDTPLSNEVSGFTFTKNMTFETLNKGDLASNSSVIMDAGNDGKIYAYNMNGQINTFQESTKSFVRKTTQIGNGNYMVEKIGVEKNGAIWAYINDMQSQLEGLYREYKSNLKEYAVSGGSNSDLSVAPDDTVYAVFTFSGNLHYLYVKLPKSDTLKRFSNYNKVKKVAVGPANDIWIINQDNDVMQWTGSGFERRPQNGQEALKISVGAQGAVYIVDNNAGLRKWNGANKSFDKVNNISTDDVSVDDEGRPWLSVNSSPVLKRAKGKSF